MKVYVWQVERGHYGNGLLLIAADNRAEADKKRLTEYFYRRLEYVGTLRQLENKVKRAGILDFCYEE